MKNDEIKEKKAATIYGFCTAGASKQGRLNTSINGLNLTRLRLAKKRDAADLLFGMDGAEQPKRAPRPATVGAAHSVKVGTKRSRQSHKDTALFARVTMIR